MAATTAALLPTTQHPTDAVLRSLAPEDEVLLNRLLSEPADFVDHPDFAKPSTEAKLFGCVAKLSGSSTRFNEPEEPVMDAVAAGDHHRPVGLVRDGVGVRMQHDVGAAPAKRVRYRGGVHAKFRHVPGGPECNTASKPWRAGWPHVNFLVAPRRPHGDNSCRRWPTAYPAPGMAG